MRVHPRACGGNGSGRSLLRDGGGPSPRVRGKLQQSCHGHLLFRSIPARAGETIARVCSVLEVPVHPRACGGNLIRRRTLIPVTGPSPRVRGKPKLEPGHRRRGRSIPARAGETSGCRRARGFPTVHPRACGGNKRATWAALLYEGPSPRVRGKLQQLPAERGIEGSIPARAGETAGARTPGSCCAVHPRACGGNSPETAVTTAMAGPSPRVRGKHGSRRE